MWGQGCTTASPQNLVAWPLRFEQPKACDSKWCRATVSRMNLEDHLGDILRKARSMTGVAPAAAASAAGLTEAELTALETSGTTAEKINFPALAALLGLNAVKLEGIAQGWLPEKKDLGLWRELHQITTTEDGCAVHCYLVWDEVTREAAVFDTGWDAAPILKMVEENQLQLKHVFITHTHPDHMAGLAKIRALRRAATGCKAARSAFPSRSRQSERCRR